MTALLIATVGLPGSGKTTWARQYQNVMQPGRPTIVFERDVWRDMFGYRYDAPDEQRVDWERAITRAQEEAIRALLAKDVDTDVVVADTNLIDKHLYGWRTFTEVCDAKFEARAFLDVPVEDCIRRDALRPPYEPGGPCSGRSVGEKVIRGMWEKYQATHPEVTVP